MVGLWWNLGGNSKREKRVWSRERTHAGSQLHQARSDQNMEVPRNFQLSTSSRCKRNRTSSTLPAIHRETRSRLLVPMGCILLGFAELLPISFGKTTKIPHAKPNKCFGDRCLIGIGGEKVTSNTVDFSQQYVFTGTDVIILVEH